ncbi:MAG TPA: serine/threonine-protein kinase, partial [Labilithrix sp.]|nr:serine/threonine-protein kinase [Labilithrix sp.]
AETNHGADLRERFAREARFLSGVSSRHVSKILAFGFDDGRPFLVLERLYGETLDAKLRRDGPIPAPTAIRWIAELLIGLRDCHDAKVIHRDIKPSNIFLHREGSTEMVKLIDFGVARLREISGESELTAPSDVIGSMGYMAPEQFKDAKSVGYTADLYAVGVVVFRTLTGRLPFVSRSLDTIIRMKREEPVPLVSSMPGMAKNPMLDAFVHRAMVRDPAGRFQSAREMLDEWDAVMASIDGTTDLIKRSGLGTDALRRNAEAVRSPHPLPPASAPNDEIPIELDDLTAVDSPPDTPFDDIEIVVERPEDLPTASHRGLRAIIQREVELQKARRRNDG